MKKESDYKFRNRLYCNNCKKYVKRKFGFKEESGVLNVII